MTDADLMVTEEARDEEFRPAGRTVVVSGLTSDAHTWNLVFLQLMLEEAGFDVVNLGPCVPIEVLVSTCCDLHPLMIVLSSVNGHGFQDGLATVEALRARPELAGTVTVIGGKLGISGERRAENARALMAAGYDAVYDDDAQAAGEFDQLLRSMAAIR
ncbi:MAG TPA: cobalamin-dependent protein [Actinocrinis sp.]|nr:cobalamin-dependent protein [Actinocrinis sp.]